MESILYETDCLGIAYTSVTPGYIGQCALDCTSGSGAKAPRVIFPNPEEAAAAARFAVGVHGGYDRADVSETNEPPTHQEWEDWAC